MNRVLTQGQKNLLKELYVHQVHEGRTDGSFRDRYMEGCQREQWHTDETLELKDMGLIRIHEGLLLAGITCVGITNSGRKYRERIN